MEAESSQHKHEAESQLGMLYGCSLKAQPYWRTLSNKVTSLKQIQTASTSIERSEAIGDILIQSTTNDEHFSVFL